MTTPRPAGVAAPGAPPRGTAGSFSLLGQPVKVNRAGIISEGPWRGKYPADILRQYSAPPTRTPNTPTVDRAQGAQDALYREQQQQAQQQLVERTRRDSYAQLNSVLADYGLGSLGKSVQQWLVEGLSEAEITQRMRDTSEFKTRFPAIEARKKAGLPPISPGEYVAYERNARQVMRAAGLPEGFYDSGEDFTGFLTNDLSLAELGDRVALAANAAFNAPAEVREALAQWGVAPGELTAYWLDPDKAQPLLERKYAAAQLAGTSTRTGFGRLTEQAATELASLGVNEQQAQQGFGRLADSRELFQSLDRTEDQIGQDEQLGAAFRGDSNAQRRIAQRTRKRQATFESGGGYAASQGGLVGLGDTE